MASPMERERALINELISFVPYGPTVAEQWADAVEIKCACFSDPRASCEPCHKTRREIVVVIRSALKEQVGELEALLEKARVKWSLGEPPVWNAAVAVEILGEIYRKISWLRMEQGL